MENRDIAHLLRQTADLMEVAGEDSFRVRSYRRAADAIDGSPVRLHEIAGDRAQLLALPGIGKAMCGHIQEIVATGKLTVRGVQGHVAYPEKVKNPIHRVAPALAELAAAHWDIGNEFFPPTSFQISNIHAGTGATNVVPGTCEVLFNFRFSTASTAEGLQERVHQILDRHGLEYDLVWTLGGRPFLTPPGRLVAALSSAIEAETGLAPELSTSGGTSDGRFIAEICPEVVEFGPVNATIHQIDECVVIADIEPLTRIYQSALRALLS